MSFKYFCLFTISLFGLSLFTSCNKSSTKITKTQVSILSKTTTSWNGDSLPHYLKGTPEITILKVVIPPQTRLKMHKHPVINGGILLKGSLTVIDNRGNILKLTIGEPIVEVVNTLHYGYNESTSESAEIIVFYAGNKDTPITIIEDLPKKLTP